MTTEFLSAPWRGMLISSYRVIAISRSSKFSRYRNCATNRFLENAWILCAVMNIQNFDGSIAACTKKPFRNFASD